VDLPQQTSGEFNWSPEDADATNKSNAGWADSITISRSWTCSVSGFSDPDDTAYLYLVDTVALGTTTDHPVYVKITNHDGDTFTGKAKIDSFSDSFGHDEVVNYSVSFTGRTQPTSTRA
jgi:predicted secreted protein